MSVMKPEPSEHMENNENQGIKGDILTKLSVHTTD